MSTPEEIMSVAMMDMGALMTPILDAMRGYRVKLEQDGYSPTAAEEMVVDYHRALVGLLLSGSAK